MISALRAYPLILVIATAAIATLSACASRPPSAYVGDSGRERDPQLARELYAKAIRNRDEPAETERLLREALSADLYHGPAHNNLGVLLLARGEYYEAASEFEWARKLMPGHPAPRVNLAMTLERAGKTDDALAAYDTALAVFEGYLPAIQGKARAQIESRKIDAGTTVLLDQIAMRGDDEWKAWAKLWRTKLGGS